MSNIFQTCWLSWSMSTKKRMRQMRPETSVRSPKKSPFDAPTQSVFAYDVILRLATLIRSSSSPWYLENKKKPIKYCNYFFPFDTFRVNLIKDFSLPTTIIKLFKIFTSDFFRYFSTSQTRWLRQWDCTRWRRGRDRVLSTWRCRPWWSFGHRWSCWPGESHPGGTGSGPPLQRFKAKIV